MAQQARNGPESNFSKLELIFGTSLFAIAQTFTELLVQKDQILEKLEEEFAYILPN